MGIKTVKDIEDLVVAALSSLFKKKPRGEYYMDNVRSIFYHSDYVQEERILDKSEEYLILRKSQVQHIKNSKLISVQSKSSQNIAGASSKLEIPFKKEKKIKNMTREFNTENSTQPNISIEQPVQKLELSDKDIKPIISCDVKELESIDVAKRPRKLNDNPHFLKIKQELESQLKNSSKFSGKSDTLPSDKNKEQKQTCGEDVLPLISNSESILILSIEPEVKPVVSNDNSPPMPPPLPIGGLANFKGPKLPLSLPTQEQKQPCNVSQNKTSIRLNLNSVLVDELMLKLKKRKDKAHPV